MAKEFYCLNFYTLYKYHGTQFRLLKDIEFSRNKACFRGYLSKLDEKIRQDKKFLTKDLTENYELIIFKASDEKVLKSTNNNKCFLTRGRLIHYVKSLEGIVGISDISVKSATYEDKSCFRLGFKITDWPIAHKFALFHIRRAYEFPFNMRILDIYRLKAAHRGLVRGMSFEIIYSLYKLAFNCGSSGHDINVGTKSFAFSKEEVKKVIHSASTTFSLDSAFDVKWGRTIITDKLVEICRPKNNKEKQLCNPYHSRSYDLEYWTDPNNVEFRDNHFLTVIKQFKELYHNGEKITKYEYEQNI